MIKKSLADWWAETHPSPKNEQKQHAGADSAAQETVEALYEKLGKLPAVDESVETIRREMAAVYRDMRSGRIDCLDGTRLAYVLDLVRKSHETNVTRDRLGAIEKAMGLSSDTRPDWLGLPSDDGVL
ncbi:hypothetical protein F6R98_20390 [Candidatus Methylospira mobilis]|uniref:Uncharacterized protein n=1 Tax=Candidatus Methylospira mobilis TaxID=1808979 RepID=A0A5Q0BL75_9GAMM|nr:hypothetical protein [Candidatus Methylospira mobilis]QFY44695.1 hypothetical protein F6R98_20390 [Candidatus Methylospira mobilis]WNV05766.1 hypothetical protein RP726_04930 [Candidatus Methylospira mobilis]